MQNPNGIRTVLLLTPPTFLLLPLSVFTVVLERISHALLAAQTLANWRSGTQDITLYGPTANSSSPAYTDVAMDIDHAPTAAILATSIFAFVVSVVGICGMWELRRVEGSARGQRIWSWVVLVWNAVVAGVCVGVLAWVCTLQRSQKGWSGYEDVGREGRFTTETWVCQIHQFYPLEGWAGPACGLAKATRFMLIPLTISAVLVILGTWVAVRSRGGAKWLLGGHGRYGAFESIYEMRPSPPQAFQPPPQYQYTPQPPPYPPFQSTPPFQPAPYSQQAPPVQKAGAATNERPVS